MSEPISVMLPTHNRRGYALLAIDSILKQTHENLELCIYDDASSDDTYGAISALMPGDQRIRLKRGAKNVGLGAARNILVRMASHDFIAFHDDDDISHPQRLQWELETLHREETIWVACTRLNIRPGEVPEWTLYDRCPPLTETREHAITCSILMRQQYYLPRWEEAGSHERDLQWVRDTWRKFSRKLRTIAAPMYAVRYDLPDGIAGHRRGPNSRYGRSFEGEMPA